MGQFPKVFLLQIIVGIFSLNASALAKTFVEVCLDNSKIFDTQLTCRTGSDDMKSVIKFTLINGSVLKSQSKGLLGNYSKSQRIVQIVHLDPQLTDLGAIEESVQFRTEKLGSSGATITIPCHQSKMAVIGDAKQAWASCSLN